MFQDGFLNFAGPSRDWGAKRCWDPPSLREWGFFNDLIGLQWNFNGILLGFHCFFMGCLLGFASSCSLDVRNGIFMGTQGIFCQPFTVLVSFQILSASTGPSSLFPEPVSLSNSVVFLFYASEGSSGMNLLWVAFRGSTVHIGMEFLSLRHHCHRPCQTPSSDWF